MGYIMKNWEFWTHKEEIMHNLSLCFEVVKSEKVTRY